MSSLARFSVPLHSFGIFMAIVIVSAAMTSESRVSGAIAGVLGSALLCAVAYSMRQEAIAIAREEIRKVIEDD